MDEVYSETGEIMVAQDSAPIAKQDRSFKENLLVDVNEQGYYATFDVETMADKKRLFSARNDNKLLRDHMNEQIEVEGFVIDTKQINDSELGVKTVPCVHIISVDGNVYQSASTGVVSSVCEIISSFGRPDTWTEPVHVECRETTTAQGFRYKYLDVV